MISLRSRKARRRRRSATGSVLQRLDWVLTIRLRTMKGTKKRRRDEERRQICNLLILSPQHFEAVWPDEMVLTGICSRDEIDLRIDGREVSLETNVERRRARWGKSSSRLTTRAPCKKGRGKVRRASNICILWAAHLVG